jgi:hypothetical protein
MAPFDEKTKTVEDEVSQEAEEEELDEPGRW